MFLTGLVEGSTFSLWTLPQLSVTFSVYSQLSGSDYSRASNWATKASAFFWRVNGDGAVFRFLVVGVAGPPD